MDDFVDLCGRAISMVSRAVKEGRLAKLDGTILCVDCGEPATEYEHRDYAKPLDVEPVCRSCNALRGPAAHDVSEAALDDTVVIIKRWAIRKEPELCKYIRTACARSERNIKQQMIYMLKQYIKMEKENDDG